MSLTPTQQTALETFQTVTSTSREVALPLLEKCSWNAQIAITRYFDGDIETEGEALLREASLPQPNPRIAENLQGSFHARSVPTNTEVTRAERVVTLSERSPPFLLSAMLFPLNYAVGLVKKVAGIDGKERLHPSILPEDLPWFEGSYAQAYDRAKQELKFLVVVLLSEEHDDTPAFVREVLEGEDGRFAALAKDENVLLWGGSVNSSEAWQVASVLGISTVPYVGLVFHTPSLGSTAMGQVAIAAGGETTADQVVGRCREKIDKYNRELAGIRQRRKQQDAERRLREEQKSAYQRSLEKDREKARRRKEAEAIREREEKEERLRKEQQEEKEKKALQWRKYRAQRIAKEPQDGTRISLRFPDGERVIRKFDPQDDLEALYAFVECREFIDGDDAVDAPHDYNHQYDFILVSPLPREEILLQDAKIGDKIPRAANLVVEKV
ncbi:UBX-domain-containing protein [Piedraia hortae CBS 480.64]|uniref:UBX-domain-containing protein n=1 Tax=Piedraia hortae CBS 480.64 TaxID=1314780 RepID=A0A6A7BZL2_9PEZI|nr:UBX-domain-containing protein [Piedraia hortae CBS 480.64]